MRATKKNGLPHFKISGLDSIAAYKNKNIVSLLIGISVGGEAHEGEKLSALVDRINKLSNEVSVSDCIWMVCDTLQRHNYMIDGKTNEEEASALSKKEGEDWIKRNMKILNKLQISYKIVRWDEWRSNTGYQPMLSEVNELYEKNDDFKTAIETSIKSFTSRFIKRHKALNRENNISEEHLETSCRSYLLEECAVIMKLWPRYNLNICEHILYPGKMTKALEYAYHKFVTKNDLFKWNKFTFKKTTMNQTMNPFFLNFIPSVNTEQFEFDNNDKRLYLIILAAGRSILESSVVAKKDKTKMLADVLIKFTDSLFQKTDSVNNQQANEFPLNTLQP